MAVIKVKCPVCGAVLALMDDPANQGKSIICPVCKEKNRYTDFKVVVPVVEMATKLNGPSSEDVTTVSSVPRNCHVGYIHDGCTGRNYPLKEGRNLVGRMPRREEPVADIAIETEDMGMSRRHFFVEVSVTPEGVAKHFAYRAENKNAIFINGVELRKGDKIVLHDGDVVKTSDTIFTICLREL